MSRPKPEKQPESQLDGFLSKYDPAIRVLAEQARERLRALLPGAIEMVYDNYNALVIGYGPTERVPEAILSIALYPRWINLYFLDGVGLPDPEGLLKGSGTRVRRILLEDISTLDKPAVRTLIRYAVKQADSPFNRKAPIRLIIKSISAKQRSRRPA